MNYKQFQNHIYSTLTEDTIKSVSSCHGVTIVEAVSGRVFVDNTPTDYTNLEEAKQSIINNQLQENISTQIKQELYEEISYHLIAETIIKHHDIRVTDTLIESYIDLASSKIFSADPVVHSIRLYNKLDCVLENHIDFILNDGTKILVNDQIFQTINNTFKEHQDVIEYMRESKDNFFYVLQQIEE